MPLSLLTQIALSIVCGALSLGLAFVLALRYRTILGRMGLAMKARDAFSVTCMSEALSLVSPLKVGMFFSKPILTKDVAGIPVKKSFVASTFDQIIDISWQVAILVPMLMLIGETTMLGSVYIEIAIVIAAVAAVLLMLRNIGSVIRIAWRFKRLLPKKARRLGKKAGITHGTVEMAFRNSMGLIYDRKLVMKILPSTLLIIMLEPVLFQISGTVFSVQIGYMEAFLIFWTSNIIGRLSGIPGGFVSRDITLFGMLVLFPVDGLLATEVILLHRLVTMSPSVVTGVAYILYYGKSFGQSMLRMRGAKQDGPD